MFILSGWGCSIPEAAELIAVDMWATGEIYKLPGFADPFPDEVDFDDYDGDFDPRLVALLQGPIAQIQDLLCEAVERGELKPERIQRDFASNSLIREETYIEHESLVTWLEERISLGDTFSEFVDDLSKIMEYLQGEVKILNNVRKVDRSLFRSILWRNPDVKSILESLRSQAEIVLTQHVASQNDNPTDKPMNTRSRRTHQAIIAALCEKAGIDLAARGAAQKIIDALELKGVSVDGNTIRKILKEIPDSLEARQK